MITVEFQKLYEDVNIPTYGTSLSAGFDIEAHKFLKLYSPASIPLQLPEEDFILLEPGQRVLVGAGFSVAIRSDLEIQIRSRSGKTLKEGLIVLNAPGTIDADYRGEVGVILFNSNMQADPDGGVIKISKGDKIAQGILAPCYKADFKLVETLSPTERGAGGYGSTDTKK